MDIDYKKTEAMLTEDEGRTTKWYKDTKGLWTNGVGHLATEIDVIGIDWTEEQVSDNFKTDVNIAITTLTKNLSWFSSLDGVRQCALINMCFNMGWPRLSGFKNMLAALSKGQWAVAAMEAKNSKWYREDVSKARSTRIINMFLSGEWQ